MRRGLLLTFAILLLLAAGVAALVWPLLQGGFSAREKPSTIEAFVAKRLRLLAIPAEARDRRNAVAVSPDVLREARAHFADHCATCHANDGSGDSDIGRSLYPPAPDMREPATQSLSDGELFFVIHNGIRFTGMPAWGGDDPEKDLDSWKLVHFIRHLPELTEDEIAEMRRLNPKSPHELEAGKQKDESPDGHGEPADHEPTVHRHDHGHRH